MVGQIVTAAGLLLAEFLGDLDGLANGLGGIRGLAGPGQGFSLAGQQSN